MRLNIKTMFPNGRKNPVRCAGNPMQTRLTASTLLTDEWVMGYQNIAALFILLPRMEQTVDEQKKKKKLNKKVHV